MSTVDKDVLLEGLSALTGVPLKHHTDVRQTAFANELNIFNFIPIAVTGKGLGAKYSMLYLHASQSTHQSQPDLQAFDDLDDFRRFDASSRKSTGKGLAAQCSTHFLYEAQSKHRSHDDFDDLDASSHKELFVNLEEFLDPTFDYDYTHERDSTCMRGDEPYKRPCGWSRIALKVLGKYPDGDAWLGTAGPRSHSVVGEWPVSYHGTSIGGATGITESYYEPGSRQMYGRGIYSTPDIKVASKFSKTICSKKDGKTYKILMQNRINPRERTVCAKKDYWLIEIPEGTSKEKTKEIVEKSIRPYGILLKEVKK